jgi:G:T-mismatch repair DNA endonuclease (very short patch repair protein)
MDNFNLEPKNRTVFWTAHIEAQHRERLSKRSYCRREGIGYASFLRWEAKISEKPATEFVEIKALEETHGPEIVIHAGEGIRIHVGGEYDAKRLVRIIEVLLAPA